MEDKKLYRATRAAKLLGITEGAFRLRNYAPAQVFDGVKLYDIDNLQWVRKSRTDKGIKRGARKVK